MIAEKASDLIKEDYGIIGVCRIFGSKSPHESACLLVTTSLTHSLNTKYFYDNSFVDKIVYFI